MKKLLCALLIAALLLPVCALADEVVNVFNWEDYIDESVLEQFEAETGIKVNYMRFTENEDMIISVESNPGAFDVVFPSDYMVERLMNRRSPLLSVGFSGAKKEAEYMSANILSEIYERQGDYDSRRFFKITEGLPERSSAVRS